MRLTLTDHLNVDAFFTQGTKKSSTDTDHAPQLLTDQTDDGHTRHEINVTPDTQIFNGTLERRALDVHLFTVGAGFGEHCDLAVQSHGHVDFRRRDQIDAELVLVQDTKDGHEEAVSAGAFLAVDVEHGDAALDGDGSRPFGRLAAQR